MLRLFARFLVLALMGWVGAVTEARADLTLTSGASAAGYQLDLFASGFPNFGTNNIGPLGVAFTSGGQVMVADNAVSNLTVFNDVNNQSYSSFSHVGGSYSSSADGLTNNAGTIYLASYFNDAVYALNNNGTLNHTVATGLGNVDGITTNPLNGHLIVSSTNGVLDIDPSNGTVTNLSTTGPDHLQFTGTTDGLTFSADGKILYAAVGGNRVEGVNMSTGALVLNIVVSGADGTALGTGTLAGNLFINTNFGDFYELNLTTNALTLLADNGSRGDFVTVDPNGTLLITQTDRIYRLTAPSGGGFGTVPEPATTLMLVSGVPIGLVYWRTRRRAVGSKSLRQESA